MKKTVSRFFFLAYGCSLAPVAFVKKTIFLYYNAFAKDQLTLFMRSILGSLFY